MVPPSPLLSFKSFFFIIIDLKSQLYCLFHRYEFSITIKYLFYTDMGLFLFLSFIYFL